MEVLVLCVALRDGVVAVDDAQLGRVFERVSVVAEQVEHTAQRPDVGLRVDPVVVPRIQHLGRPVHRRCVLRHLPATGYRQTGQRGRQKEAIVTSGRRSTISYQHQTMIEQTKETRIIGTTIWQWAANFVLLQEAGTVGLPVEGRISYLVLEQ